jgi:hypothetical protein
VGRLATFRHDRTHCEPFSNKRLANIGAIRLNKAIAGHHLQASHPSFAEGDIAGVRYERLQTRPGSSPELPFAGAGRRLAGSIQLMQSDQVAIDSDMFRVDDFSCIAARGANEREPKRQKR